MTTEYKMPTTYTISIQNTVHYVIKRYETKQIPANDLVYWFSIKILFIIGIIQTRIASK